MPDNIKKVLLKVFVFLVLAVFVIFAWKYSAPIRKIPIIPIESAKEQWFGYINVGEGLDVKTYKGKGNRVLALFDGTENKSWSNNEIRIFTNDILENMGLKVDYHDISSGLIPEKEMENYMAIITWYTDSEMPDAAKYSEWLAGQIRHGIKVVILGNFGAYKDSNSKQWLSLNIPNMVFNALGISYQATWTSDPNILRITYKDKNMVEYQHPLSMDETRHYFLFKPTTKDIRKFLSIERTDVPNSESCIVATTPYGGMALANYIYWNNPNNGEIKMRLDFKRFLLECLWFASENVKEQKTLILWDSENKDSKELLENIAYSFKYAKINFEAIDIKRIEYLVPTDLNEYSCIVFALENLWKINSEHLLNGLKKYVSDGGAVVSFYNSYHKDLGEIFGIKKYIGTYKKQLTGIKFLKELYPGMDKIDIKRKDIFETSVFDLDLAKDIDVIAISQDKTEKYPNGFPLVWKYKYGKGRTIFWNMDSLIVIGCRGMILQSILSSQKSAVASLANIEVIFIDDWSRPMWNKIIPPVNNITDTDFYAKQWWPDMVLLSQNFRIRYTSAIMFNYNDNVSPPFDNSHFYIGKDNISTQIANDIIDKGFEMGLHGYNHQSLVNKPIKDISRGWKTEDDMVAALTSAKNEWDRIFTHQPFTYVAPNNVIDEMGIRAIARAFPSIKVISTVWSQQQDVTRKEFGRDKLYYNFYNIPRTSSGYLVEDDNYNGFIDGLATFGVWTHFVHPDDIYSYERSKGDTWEKMFQGISLFFTYARKTYPWLRNMTAKDAYYELIRYEDTSVKYFLSDNKIDVSYDVESIYPRFFVVRLNSGQNIKEVENAKIIHSYDDGIYIFTTNSMKSTIHLK